MKMMMVAVMTTTMMMLVVMVTKTMMMLVVMVTTTMMMVVMVAVIGRTISQMKSEFASCHLCHLSFLQTLP